MKKINLLLLAILGTSTSWVQAQLKTDIAKKAATEQDRASLNAQSISYQAQPIATGALLYKTNNKLNTYNVRKTGNSYYWIEITSTQSITQNPSVQPNNNEQVIYTFISQINPSLFGLNSTLTYNLIKTDVESDEKTYRMQQIYNGYPIYNAVAVCKVNNGIVSNFIGEIKPINKVANTFSITSQVALIAAMDYIAAKGIKIEKTNPLLGYENTSVQLIYPTSDDNYKAAYKLNIFPNNLQQIEVIVDAQTGDLLQLTDLTCEIDGPKTTTALDLHNVSRTVGSYELSGNTFLIDASKSMFSNSASNLPNNPVGAIWTINANNTYLSSLTHCTSSDNSLTRKDAISAQYNASLCYDYFKNTHGRNSIDGSGGTIISVVNVSDDNGSAMDNAFWNGKLMAYGNGKTAFTPLAGGLDVGGHEMTHGVVEKTASLVYQGQSGALNESFADIFGAMIDRDDWLMGEEIVKTSAFPSGALRSLSDPHNGGNSLNDRGYQPKHMQEYYTGSQDNQGVHINSGIPNHAFFKLASAITKEKAEKIYYRALAQYLTNSSQFIDCRYAVIKAATDLHGANSTEVTECGKAFDAVGIYDPNPSTGGSGSGGSSGEGTYDLPTNTGTAYVLVSNSSTTATNQIYLFNVSNSNLTPISTSKHKHMPSITDDGSKCLFVDDADKIVSMELTSPYNEFYLGSQAVWGKVAISKDGNLFAATTTLDDTSIYVYNFTLNKMVKYKLYNPTYSGVNSGGVDYADVLEFNHSGEYIIYDAKNTVKLSDGSTLEYWDIGLLHVWDRDINNFGDGKIEKLFNQLGEGISIGNPTFSRNSPHIIAFDYIDENDGTYAALGYNISSTDLGVITLTQDPSRPMYYLDDKDLVFTNNPGVGTGVYFRGLEANKIKGSSTTSNTLLVSSAIWGNPFAQGKRRLLNNENTMLTFSLPALTPPVSCNINGNSITATVPFGTDLSSVVPTFTSSPASKVNIAGINQTSSVDAVNLTNTVVYTVKAQDGSSKNYNVTISLAPNADAVQPTTMQLVVSPNPANNLLHLNINDVDFRILDLTGKLLFNGHTNNGTVAIDKLSAGNYIIQINNDTVSGNTLFTVNMK